MRKIVAGLAITLDGVVEAPSTSSWMLFNDEMAAVIDAGIAQADAILLGRRTYLEFAELWPTLLSGDLVTEVTRLKQQPGRNIQVPGSPRLVWSLLREGLLDELALMIHPIVLGSGQRLFDEPTDQVRLKLLDSRTLSTGVVSVVYQPA